MARNSRSGVVMVAAACLAARAQTQAPDAAFRQGSEMYRAGNCAEAVRLLSQSKGTPRASLLMGRCYLEMADFDKGRKALQQYMLAVPGDQETAAILLARAAEGLGDAEQGIDTLEQLRKKIPASMALQDALADAYVKTGKMTQASAIINAVLAAHPDDIGALMALAELDAATKQWASGDQAYKKVLALSPDNFEANSELGLMELAQGQTAAATPYLQHAARLQPGNWGITYALAGSYVKTGKWPETIQALEYDSLAHADDEQGTGYMVQAFTHTGDAAHAERYYRAVLQHNKGNFTARMTLANLLYDSKRAKDAKEQYILVLNAKPDLFEIQDRVGQIAEQEGNLPEALPYYAAASQSPQATMAIKMRLARAYFKTADMEHARPALETVLKTEPDNREVKTMLLHVAVKTGKTDDAVRYAGELLPGDSNNLELLRLLGEDALKRNKDTDAADLLERAATLDAKDRELRFELVTLYTNNAALDRLPRAFDLMNEYVGLTPEDYEGYLLLANLYRRKGDAANARDYFARGFAKMPPKPPARMSWAYNSVGLLLFSEGNFEEALANQLRAVELNPADANSEYNLGLTYLKLKRKDEVNAARERLSQMAVPELVSALDEAIQRSRINETKK